MAYTENVLNYTVLDSIIYYHLQREIGISGNISSLFCSRQKSKNTIRKY